MWRLVLTHGVRVSLGSATADAATDLHNLVKNEDSWRAWLPYSFIGYVGVDLDRNARAHQHSSEAVNAGGGS